MNNKRKKKKLFSFSLVPLVTPAILATQEVEIRRLVVQGQPEQIVSETPSQPIKS
jgi:hypothetical protein